MSDTKSYDVAIIGGGVIGLTIAKEFLENNIKNICLLEKNRDVMLETSSHNSGVIHSGFDATPGTLKAKFNVEGRHLFEQRYLKKDAKFHWENINSYILAFDDEDIKELNLLYEQGIKNGLNPKSMQIIDNKEILKVNPYLNKKIIKALLVNTSKIIDAHQFGNFIFEEAKKLGLKYHLNFKVNDIKKEKNEWVLKSEKDQIIKAKYIINASGVWSEEIARLVEKNPLFKIKTRRGQYLILDHDQRKYTTFDVFFLTPSKHGKGVIIAPLLDGRVLVGPNAEDNIPKNDIQIVTEKGLKHVRKIGKKINPNIDLGRVVSVLAGSRSINELTNDYYIETSKEVDNFFHVAGIQSPGLSSSPAIARYVYKKYLETKK
ncbi:type 2 glycerol-3-phosphate oxidase [Candidatus Hepatoplasma crinochetorum]|uniref:type 2 glycerol-3-phosphate oxidase n=1 Tax=Candidatus Hepatoplasma crinochetorum TaxID=295596 RepID=UPI00308D1A1D|nr:MAG: glycerol-3-phosphate dehydrogenase [Candidatus Hepatoplasma crinochetorum]